jgi:hypothetical protein
MMWTPWVDAELLGHFDDRVPRWPVAAAEPAQTTPLPSRLRFKDDTASESEAFNTVGP